MFDHVIVTHPKDFECLPLCVEGLENISGSSGKAYVISSEDPKLNGVEFVNEKEFDHIIKFSDIRDRLVKAYPSTNGLQDGLDRTGWYYQQFLKMHSGELLNTTDRFHVLCSDTIFLNDPGFNENVFHFQLNPMNWQPYKVSINNIFEEGFWIGDMTMHHMLFCRNGLQKMKERIEEQHGKDMCNSILDRMTYESGANMSEYALFGNWMVRTEPEKSIQYFLRQQDLLDQPLPTKEVLKQYKDNGYHYVNSHEHSRT